MISSAPIGTSQVDFNRRPAGVRSKASPEADFLATAAEAMAASNSNLAAPDSAISLKRFSAAAAGDRRLAAADSDARRVRREAVTSRRTSWFRSRKFARGKENDFAAPRRAGQ